MAEWWAGETAFHLVFPQAAQTVVCSVVMTAVSRAATTAQSMAAQTASCSVSLRAGYSAVSTAACWVLQPVVHWAACSAEWRVFLLVVLMAVLRAARTAC